MPEHFFMVKGTCNECKCLGFPPQATEISLFSAFRCRSGVAVAGAEKHLERKPLPGSQKGSFQDIALQRVTFATLGITVWF